MNLIDRIEQFFCGAKGHGDLMKLCDYTKGRVYLECSKCSWRSSGWDLKVTKPKVRYLNLQVMREARRKVA